MIKNNYILKFGIFVLVMLMLGDISAIKVLAKNASEDTGFEHEKEWEEQFLKECSVSGNRVMAIDPAGMLSVEGQYSGNSKIAFLGDSCSHGYQNPQDAEGEYIHSFVEVLSQMTGNDYYNVSWYGASMAVTEYNQSHLSSQLQLIANLQDYDLVFIQFGINDYCMHVPLGGKGSTDVTTLCGALNANLSYIRAQGAEPVVIVPFFYYGQFLDDEVNQQNVGFYSYVDAIREVCLNSDVAMIDFNTMFNITPSNFNDYYLDWIHPNQTLQNMAAQKLYDFIVSYKDANPTVEDFVNRMYRLCLQREADEGGREYWVHRLLYNQNTGMDIAAGFVFSKEMYDRNLSDSDYLDVLYETLMGRSADLPGKNYWLERMQNGMSREGIFLGFVCSDEYKRICDSYGITLGSAKKMSDQMQARDRNYGLTSFISRLYTKALGRSYDVDGLNYWCNKVYSKEMTITEISTYGFFCSNEFLSKNLNDEEYIRVLYRTFLDREPEEAGFEYWKKKMLNGMSKQDVMLGFSESVEFGEMKRQYGL